MADCLVCLLDHVKEVGKSIVTDAICPPIKRNVGYWWFIGDNLQCLSDEINHLKREKDNMDRKIKEAKLRVESATPEVKNWLDRVQKQLEEGERISQSCDQLKPWNIIPRYLVGKSAKKTVEGIAKLRNEVESITISDPPCPPSMDTIPHEPTTEFESRRHVKEAIIESLKDDHVQMIAICGPGGVGKTTMVQRIEESVRNKLFDEIVTVVVSQQIDKLKLQKEITEVLGLPLGEATLVGRAHKIRNRLLDSTTKLIIFDDVWESFDLKDIGVPLGNGFERCKIILTSRLKDVCEEMDAHKVFQIKVLDEEEAWRLFREKSGVREDDSELRLIAEAVAAECKGLPIAIVPVAKALKNKGMHTWEDSLLQLKRSNPTNFPKVLEDVYKPLKLSYDFLQTRSEKLLFLLCCLFPEDYDIPVEFLTLYSFGLGILEGIMNIDEGRNRTHHLVERLKNRFLLIDGRWGDDIKMHDVVRDVAIFIGSKEHVFLKSLKVFSMDSPSLDSSRDCRWMSTDISIAYVKFPVGSYFPYLHLLMIWESDFKKRDDVSIDFEGMEELKVLVFSDINLRSFPPTLELLKNLKALHLDSSEVRDISVVGELTSLEILSICFCDDIKELPADIGRLNRLRLLELSNCKNLERVAEGVISSLVGLEELKMFDSFDEWGAKVNGSEERNASLLELEFLPNLTCLEIDISDSNLVAQEMCLLSQQLVRYQIHFFETEYGFDDTKYERNISLNLRGDITVGNWIRQLVRSTQSLILSGDGSNYINLAEIESLKQLIFTHCSTVKQIDCRFSVLEQLYLRHLTEVKSIADGTISVFQKLELLDIKDLPKLAHLWRSPNQNVSLANLKEMIIHDCPSLCSLFSLETVRSLVQLQLLEIERCDMFEQLFWTEIESNYIEDEIIEFPQLTKLKIIDCPKFRTKIGKCPDLRTIQLYAFHGLHHLLSSCCTRTWNTQLHKLLVSDCDTVEELLVDEIEDEGNRHIIFPELEELKLRDLPCLTTFCRGVESIKFPKLERIEIINLPRLNKLAPTDSEPTHDDHSVHFFCNQKVEIPCLETLRIVKLRDTISKMWCRLVPNNFFHKLKELYISDVNGIRNLMSSSIVENLVNLERLSINRCQEMTEVVEDDKEISVMSLFPKLMYIKISNLRKLKSFCQRTHALEFPSLSEVNIVNCPGMETFTLGSLSTPHYFASSINGGPYETKDLNDSIRDHFMTESQEGRREKTEEEDGREKTEDVKDH